MQPAAGISLSAGSVTVTPRDAVARPFLGFGVNWKPYWDKPSTLPAKALRLTDEEWQTVVWESPVLLYGRHTLAIRVMGENEAASANAFVPLDRLEIIPQLDP